MEEQKILFFFCQSSQKLTGDKKRTTEYFKEVLELDREDTDVWTFLGNYQYENNEDDKAIQSYQAVLSLTEDSKPEVALKLALLNIKIGKYEDAYDLLMYSVEAVELSLTWCYLGVCCMRLNDFQEADVSFIQSIALDRWDPTTWGYSAILCSKMGREIEGEQALIFAGRLGLKDYTVITEIISLYDGKIKGEEAKSQLEFLKTINPEDCFPSIEPLPTTDEEEQLKEEEEEQLKEVQEVKNE